MTSTKKYRCSFSNHTYIRHIMSDLPFRQIVNELSFEEGAKSLDYTDRIMSFLAIVLKLADAGMDRALTISRTLTSRTTEGGQALYNWLFDMRSQRECQEERRVLRAMFTKGLNTEDIFPMCNLGEEITLVDNGMQLCTPDYVSGLAVSYHANLPAVSLSCDGRHGNGAYGVNVHVLADDGEDCHVNTKSDCVHTIVNLSQVEKELERIRLESIKVLLHCDSVTVSLAGMLSHLEFSSKAASQLAASDFRQDKEAFQWVCLTLFKLDYAWGQVRSGEEHDFSAAIKMGNCFAPTESRATRNAFSDTRTFLDSAGRPHKCLAHCKNIFLNKRIYFEMPDGDMQRLFVGSVGGHLPIVSE